MRARGDLYYICIEIETSHMPPHNSDHVYDTYGTIEPMGVRKVLDVVNIGPSDVFYDLGSGIGNVVVQVFKETNARKCVGIEIDANRHADALKYSASDVEQAEYRKGREMVFLKDILN